MDIIMSFYMLVVALVAIGVPGFLVTSLLMRDDHDEKLFWPLLPFIGISISILVLQNLVYLGISIKKAAPFYLLIMTILFVLYWFKAKPRIPLFPKALALIALLVLTIHGLGYWVVGARHYISYGWLDSNTYIATAQFLMDKPYATDFKDIVNTPYLVKAILQKSDRIGQSILQGYIATIGMTNARTAWGITSLLGPFLTMLAIWMLVGYTRIKGWFQYVAVASCSLLPGLAMIHLECFLSQALATPFLMLWPIVVNRIFEKGSFGQIIIGALLLAAANSIYTDYTILFVGIALVIFLWHFFESKSKISLSIAFCLLILSAIVFNLGYYHTLTTLFDRVNVVNVLSNVYPFAFKVEGLTRLWFGIPMTIVQNYINQIPQLENFPKIIESVAILQNISSIALIFFAIAGLMNLFFRHKDAVTFSLLSILLIPAAIIAKNEPMPYQFYKLLLTVAPLLMLGICEFVSMVTLQPSLITGGDIMNTGTKSIT